MGKTMHSFSVQNFLRTILFFFVLLFLFFLPLGGLNTILNFFDIPLGRFLSSFGVVRWSILTIHIGSVLWKMFLIGLSILSMLVFLSWYHNIRPKDVGLVLTIGRKGWKQDLLLQIKIFLGFAVVLILLSNILYSLFHITDEHYLNLLNPKGAKYGKLSIISPFTPILEEIVFRGVFCTLLIRYGLRWPLTIFVTGLAFGLVHSFTHPTVSTPVLISGATATGWFLGWIFYKTRTVIMPIFWHYLINVSLYAIYLMPPNLFKKIFEFMIFFK